MGGRYGVGCIERSDHGCALGVGYCNRGRGDRHLERLTVQLSRGPSSGVSIRVSIDAPTFVRLIYNYGDREQKRSTLYRLMQDVP